VLILVNGRRAGTANVSKLSPSDVERIEVVRGPSSVVYGSQNIGGVINVITKTGRTSPGETAQVTVGSYNYFQGLMQVGGVKGPVDFYLGLSTAKRGDHKAGDDGPTQVNTSYERKGLDAALGYQLTDNQRLSFTARTDGIYDAGFRGSAANIFSKEDRYNNSVDLAYTGQAPDLRLAWNVSAYGVVDVDNLRWASPIIRSGNAAVAGTSKDYNRRQINIQGLRVQPTVNLWTGNQILLGYDHERSTVRSTRVRVGVNGAAIAQIAPYDNNQTEVVNAFYFEDAQRLFDDRLTIRGGARRTQGDTSFDPTPNLAGQVTSSRSYESDTYSVGASLRVLEGLTLRANTATGFRAPNATELGADFIALGGGRTFGNPNLSPESSKQFEVGAIYRGFGWDLDLALFQNTIKDRIITLPRPGVVNTSDYINNPGDVVIQGLEAMASANLAQMAGLDGWSWTVNAGGSYHFKMEDKGAPATASTRNVQRVYKYQAAVSTSVGRPDARFPWSAKLDGALHGPIWYDTEENLLVPQAEPTTTFIHRKSPFWVWNARLDVDVTPKVQAFVAVNNLLDKDYHPLLISTASSAELDPRFANGGGLGTSLPGRNYQVGVRFRFGAD
jgi:vitamin B12 transporter